MFVCFYFGWLIFVSCVLVLFRLGTNGSDMLMCCKAVCRCFLPSTSFKSSEKMRLAFGEHSILLIAMLLLLDFCCTKIPFL